MQLDKNLIIFNLYLALNVYFWTISPPDNLFQYSNAHPHGYSEKSLSWKGKKKTGPPSSGSVPRVEKWPLGDKLLVEETGWVRVRCTSRSSCFRWHSFLAVSPVWCRSLRRLLSNIVNESANFTSVFPAFYGCHLLSEHFLHSKRGCICDQLCESHGIYLF